MHVCVSILTVLVIHFLQRFFSKLVHAPNGNFQVKIKAPSADMCHFNFTYLTSVVMCLTAQFISLSVTLLCSSHTPTAAAWSCLPTTCS